MQINCLRFQSSIQISSGGSLWRAYAKLQTRFASRTPPLSQGHLSRLAPVGLDSACSPASIAIAAMSLSSRVIAAPGSKPVIAFKSTARFRRGIFRFFQGLSIREFSAAAHNQLYPIRHNATLQQFGFRIEEASEDAIRSPTRSQTRGAAGTKVS